MESVWSTKWLSLAWWLKTIKAVANRRTISHPLNLNEYFHSIKENIILLLRLYDYFLHFIATLFA